ncbi:hypothetical protein C8J56DRAFT_892252 [Mycena floridula]|nr:hypothetical protein C8J56DRAFT_892252 [Mycena floridula]
MSATPNPHNESCPDFEGSNFQQIIQDLADSSEKSVEDIVAEMRTSWQKGHDRRVEQWDAKEHPEIPEKPARKVPKFNEALAVSTVIESRPSSYAILKLDSFAHVELYYFTPEGCDEAARSSRSTEDEGFGLTRTGTDSTTVALKPLSSFKASPKAIPDSQLNWDQFCLGSSGFLHAIEHRIGDTIRKEKAGSVTLALQTKLLSLDNSRTERALLTVPPESFVSAVHSACYLATLFAVICRSLLNNAVHSPFTGDFGSLFAGIQVDGDRKRKCDNFKLNT